MKEITLLIADDHPIFRHGLQQIIESENGMKVLASVSDGDAAIDGIRKLRPDVAVLDVDMPKRDGFGVLTQAREESLPSEVILLTMHREERFFNAALEAGVKGYVLKDSAVEEITSAIRAAADGENFVSPALTSMLVRRARRETSPTTAKLTNSELRVLRLVADELSNQQIADELFVSVRTIENHRANICAKLGLTGKNALLAYAIKNQEKF